MDQEELKEDIMIDEEEAKKQFLEELKNKNKKEQKRLIEIEEAKIAAAKAAEAEAEAAEREAAAKLEEEKNQDEKEEKKDLAVVDEATAVAEKKSSVNSKILIESLISTVVDTAVVAVVAVVAVALFNAILKGLFGYYIVDYEGAYLIALFIFLILYPIIMKNTKLGETLGSKLNKAKVQERNQ